MRLICTLLYMFTAACLLGQTQPYPIVDTGQTHVFSDSGQLRNPPRQGQAYFGQDGHYLSNPPQYRDNGDGTVSDLVTGLMWQKTPDLRDKQTFGEAMRGADSFRLAGHDDWRLPTIKELYSLIQFEGNARSRPARPYIDTDYFDFVYGNEYDSNARQIDAQYWSSTQYVGTTMNDDATVFGVNFADGRIKGYPRDRGRMGGPMRQFVRYVRGNPEYGRNSFIDNGDGTISDLATGLMWTKADSRHEMNWRDALAWCENQRTAGHNDWRLPNAKELQSIVDYTRAPDAAQPNMRGPAIDPIFDITDGEGWFWTSTTHLEAGRDTGSWAVYIAFGRATGFMTFPGRPPTGDAMNVHGAGAQRSSPKSGDESDYAGGFGPQGDEIRIDNYVRAVRNIDPAAVQIVTPDTDPVPQSQHPDPGSMEGGESGRRPPPPGRGFRPPPRRGR